MGSPFPMEIHLTDNTRPLIVYFDHVPTYGVLNGAIQVELTAMILHALNGGGVESETVNVAHLRCSPAAAVHLLGALQSALQMLHEQQGPPPSTVN